MKKGRRGEGGLGNSGEWGKESMTGEEGKIEGESKWSHVIPNPNVILRYTVFIVIFDKRVIIM